MFSDMSKPTFMLAVLVGGLALFVAGFVIALEVRSTVASPAAATTGGACYTNWNGNTCAAGYTAVSTGEWTSVVGGQVNFNSGDLICASAKTEDPGTFSFNSASASGSMHTVSHEPCAICCASAGAAVGGIGELPDVAATGDGLARNHIIIAAVSAMIAFGAGAFYARKRWLG